MDHEVSLTNYSISSSTCCNQMLKKLEITNQNSSGQQRRLVAAPQVKDLIEKAVGKLHGPAGSTKEDIIGMAETLYPPLVNDQTMQRSLDQAFSKYLQVQPARVMLTSQMHHQPPPDNINHDK